MPDVCGRSSRGGERSVPTTFPRARSVTSRGCRSTTLPRFASTTPTTSPRARTEETSRRCCTRPGIRTITVTPIRMRTATAPDAADCVVSRTSAAWSPGAAAAGGVTASWNATVACGATTRRRGRSTTHAVARCAEATRGRPRGPSAKPARPASTTMARAPLLVRRITACPAPFRETRAGEAVSAATGGVGAARITVRSP